MEENNKKKKSPFLFITILFLILFIIFLLSLIFRLSKDKVKPIILKDNFKVSSTDNLNLHKDGMNNKYFKSRTFEDFNLSGITSDGINFYYKNNDKYELVNDKDKLYYSYDISLTSLVETEVYLGVDSFVKPYEDIKSDNIARGNELTNLSSDIIASTVRVAFYEINENTEELKFIWIPNEEYELLSDYTFNKYSHNIENYGYYDVNNNEFKEYSIDNYYNGFVKAGSKLSAIKNNIGYINSSISILKFDSNDVLNNKEKTIRIKLWYDCLDRDYHEEFLNGIINVNISLIDINKTNQPEELINKFESIYSFNGFLKIGLDDLDLSYGFTILYSYDGKSFTYYNKANLIEFKGRVIYIKISETKDYKESYIIKLIIE